jgi:hypothetical protein
MKKKKWNVRSLKEHFDSVILLTDQRLSAAILAVERSAAAATASSEKAITKAETASEKRFDSVNEFRQMSLDQNARFATTNDMISQNEKIISLQTRLDRIESRAIEHTFGESKLQLLKNTSINSNANIIAVIAVIVAVVTVVVSLLTRKP